MNEQKHSYDDILIAPQTKQKLNRKGKRFVTEDGQHIYPIIFHCIFKWCPNGCKIKSIFSFFNKNSITVFKVNDDHTLSLVQRISTFGDFPRAFNWDADQKYVVVANQNTDNATLYIRNGDSGTLTPIQTEIPVPEGTRVLFTK